MVEVHCVLGPYDLGLLSGSSLLTLDCKGIAFMSACHSGNS